MLDVVQRQHVRGPADPPQKDRDVLMRTGDEAHEMQRRTVGRDQLLGPQIGRHLLFQRRPLRREADIAFGGQKILDQMKQDLENAKEATSG